MGVRIVLRPQEWKGGFKNLVQNWEQSSAQLSAKSSDIEAFGKALRKAHMQLTHVARDLDGMRKGKGENDPLAIKVGVYEGGAGGKIWLGAKAASSLHVLLNFRGQVIDTKALLSGEKEEEVEEEAEDA